MLAFVNVARGLAIVAAIYAAYLLWQTLLQPDLMAPALASSAAVSLVIAIVPYCIARLLGDMVATAAPSGETPEAATDRLLRQRDGSF